MSKTVRHLHVPVLISKIAVAAVVCFLCSNPLIADITVIQRESSAVLNVFAGSGPGVDSYNNSGGLDTPTGPFFFDDEAYVFVANQTGSAEAFGAITVSDGVFNTETSLDVTIDRNSNGSVRVFTGTGLTGSTQRHELRVRFEIMDTRFRYELTGFFNEGVENGPARVRLRNVVSNVNEFIINTSQSFLETGIIEPNNNNIRTFEFIAEINDSMSGHLAADVSVMNLQFSVEAIPNDIVLGDTNQDGQVNLLDVGPFIELVSSGDYLAQADTNEDGAVNLLDIDPFIVLVSGD